MKDITNAHIIVKIETIERYLAHIKQEAENDELTQQHRQEFGDNLIRLIQTLMK